MKILLTGATGYVGSYLGRRLVSLGHEVVSLTRDKEQYVSFKTRLIEMNELSSEKGIQAVIHLAGASVAGQRWTKEYKRTLVKSRVAFTSTILRELDYENLEVFLQASATGFYPSSKDRVLTEQDSPGSGFLSKLCVDWEEASSGLECRKTYFRIGMVIGEDSPAMKKMKPLFENRIGAVLGSGKQYMSWVHIEDLTNMFVKALGDFKFSGAYNAVAPNPIRNKDFTRLMGEALDKAVILPPAPKFALNILYGEMSQILLDSHNVIPKRLQAEGFDFKYDSMDKALKSFL